MNSGRVRKKHWGRMHWHGNADGSDRICYSSHVGLKEARERRVDSLVRRRMRRDIRKAEVVTGSRYGKSLIPITQFFNITIDASNFVAAMKRAHQSLEQLSLYWETRPSQFIYKEIGPKFEDDTFYSEDHFYATELEWSGVEEL